MEPEPEPEPESSGLAPLFRDLDLLPRVLCLLGLWEVGRIGCAVSKPWSRAVRATFGRALAAPGRDVRIAGLDAAHPLVRLNGSVGRAVEPSDDAERAALLEAGCVKLRAAAGDDSSLPAAACALPNQEGTGKAAGEQGCVVLPLTSLLFETPLCAPLLDAAVRAEVTQQHRGESLTKAGHMKSMAVAALQPCLPFACHRCGARPEAVTLEHPQGRAEPGRQKWWQALRGQTDSRATKLECMECLILAAAEAGLTPDDDLGMFQWQRCVGVMEFFSRHQQMDRRGQISDREDDEGVGDVALFAAAFGAAAYFVLFGRFLATFSPKTGGF